MVRKRVPWAWIIIAVLIAGIIVVMGLYLKIQNADLMTIVVLSFTLVAVVWYSFETRLLRLQQVYDVELRHHPWISLERLKSTWENDGSTLVKRECMPFMVQNFGTTPAYNLRVKGQWYVKGNAGAEKFEDKFDYDLGTVLPKMKQNFNVNIKWQLVSEIFIKCELSYRSFQHGRGKFDYIYEISHGIKKEHCESVNIWLSNGREIHAPAIAHN